MLHDFMSNLAGEHTNKESANNANEYLVNYFIAHGYGKGHYSEDDLRQIFKEMNALQLLFPHNGKMKLIALYANWRIHHHKYWFKKWDNKRRGFASDTTNEG